MSKKIRISIDLPIEILAQLAVISAELDISVNEIVNQALKDFIARRVNR